MTFVNVLGDVWLCSSTVAPPDFLPVTCPVIVDEEPNTTEVGDAEIVTLLDPAPGGFFASAGPTRASADTETASITRRISSSHWLSLLELATHQPGES